MTVLRLPLRSLGAPSDDAALVTPAPTGAPTVSAKVTSTIGVESSCALRCACGLSMPSACDAASAIVAQIGAVNL